MCMVSVSVSGKNHFGLHNPSSDVTFFNVE